MYLGKNSEICLQFLVFIFIYLLIAPHWIENLQFPVKLFHPWLGWVRPRNKPRHMRPKHTALLFSMILIPISNYITTAVSLWNGKIKKRCSRSQDKKSIYVDCLKSCNLHFDHWGRQRSTTTSNIHQHVIPNNLPSRQKANLILN